MYPLTNGAEKIRTSTKNHKSNLTNKNKYIILNMVRKMNLVALSCTFSIIYQIQRCNMGRKKECENELVKKQTYKFNNTVIKVEPVFKETGTRTLLHSLSSIIKDDIKDS